MTTVAVLVLRNDLIEIFGDSWTNSNLNDYISYRIRPYLNLGVFSYCETNANQVPIDGKNTPVLLQEELEHIVRQQTASIKLLEAKIPSKCSPSELRKHSAGIVLLSLLAGKFSDESIFYNIATDSSFIDVGLIIDIKNSPQNYILTKMAFHK